MRTIVAVILAVLALPAVAAARVSEAKIITTPSGLISCHAVLAQAGGGISCSAPYLQRPASMPDGDPYLALKQRGAARLGARGDYDGYQAKQRKLAYGDTWKRPGIRCSLLTSGLTCHNRDGHGFHLAKGAARRF